MRAGFFAGSIAAVFLGLGASAAEAAVFDGGTVDFQYYAYGGPYNALGSPASFTTPGSATFFNYFTVTVSGNQITYDFLNTTTWSPSVTSLNSGGLFITNGSLISSVSGIPSFTSVSIDPSSILGSSGFTSADVTRNSGAVAVTWANLSFTAGDTVVLDVNAAPGPIPGAGLLSYIAIGFLGLGSLAWKLRRAA